MNSVLHSLLYDIIYHYYKLRHGKGIHPAAASELEIYNDVRKVMNHALNEMVGNGTLSVTQNVNGLRLYAPSDVKCEGKHQ